MLATAADNESALRERRCIATGAILPEDELVRYVVSPDGDIVPDLDAKLPGRGIWLSATRTAMAKAMAKGDFARCAKAKVTVPADLPERVEHLLVTRIQADLGMARRAGLLDAGFDNVLRALGKKISPCLLFQAADASADGRRKLDGVLRSRGLKAATIDLLTRDELGLALGRQNVVHAAVRPGVLADRLKLNAKRLAGLRGEPPNTRGSARLMGPARPKGSAQNESTS
jgi:uncharacterized protein